MDIQVSFETWRELTALRESESDSYDAVILRLLGGERVPVNSQEPVVLTGLMLRGIWFADGTEFRANYKGRTYFADIINGRWIDRTTGDPRNSPSSAASAITGSNANGRTFWFAKRPGDGVWQRLSDVR